MFSNRVVAASATGHDADATAIMGMTSARANLVTGPPCGAEKTLTVQRVYYSPIARLHSLPAAEMRPEPGGPNVSVHSTPTGTDPAPADSGEQITIPDGFVYGDANSIEWRPMKPGMDMKSLGQADGQMMALYRFDAGYVGTPHEHNGAEFTYVIEGTIVSDGLTLTPGHGWSAPHGTPHKRFYAETDATVVSVFTPGHSSGFDHDH